MPRTQRLLPILVGLLLSACLGGGGTDAASSPTDQPTPTPTPEPTVEPTPEATPTPSPTTTEAATPSPSRSPVTVGPPGGFAVAPHPEADALFEAPDTCTNQRDNYAVTFPDDWWTNTEIGKWPACVWFSPTFYEVPDESQVPEEIAIVITWHEGDVGRTDADVESTEQVNVGGQPATRTEWGDGVYWYVIHLGPTPEEGSNLLVATGPEMGGDDLDLTKAVMDRMMASIEFFGSIQ